MALSTMTLFNSPHDVFLQANLIRHLIRNDRAEAESHYLDLVADVLASMERSWIVATDCAEAAEILGTLRFDLDYHRG